MGLDLLAKTRTTVIDTDQHVTDQTDPTSIAA